ncbi:MAG: polysaccharide deacetylase [Burkholderiales bacterium]|nr:MAG: polysaccharide deacetylase [Burkholderiales bacterium]
MRPDPAPRPTADGFPVADGLPLTDGLPRADGSTVVNAMSIDVEDYFHVSAFEPQIHRDAWERFPCRVERNVERVLTLLAGARARATFFVLGWVAERYPRLVKAIAEAGHEVASHGHGHRRAGDQPPAAFLEDIRRAKSLLEDITGQPVKGYRAPSFSFNRHNSWAFDCVLEAGYRYSSSVYPVRHDHYGMPEAPRFPYSPRPGLLEVPVTTARLWNANLPAGGGGYFRLFPYAVSRAFLRRVNRVDGMPAVFYFHPWELDPEQPRVPGVALKARFRHYLNLARTERRLKRLLDDFAWDRVDRVFLKD